MRAVEQVAPVEAVEVARRLIGEMGKARLSTENWARQVPRCEWRLSL